MNASLARPFHEGDPRHSALADRALLGTSESGALAALRIVEHLDESFDYTAAAADVALFPRPNGRPTNHLLKVSPWWLTCGRCCPKRWHSSYRLRTSPAI